MIDLTLFSLLVRLREGTAFVIKGGSVFFIVVSFLKHAVQTDRSSKVVWVLCICHFVLFHVNHLYQIFLVTSVTTMC